MFLPASKEDMKKRGWTECDVVIVTPDAYADHPSFAAALLGRFLEKKGYRVCILSQPRWKDPQSFLEFGVPRLAFAVSGGQMDSMVLNYTASKIPRKQDMFCEDRNPYFSHIGETKYRIRPDRCVSVYVSQIKAACRDKPIIIGGIEASLRRCAHYDYWSDKVKKSLLIDSKASVLLYGMGEFPLLNTLKAIENGVSFADAAVSNSVVAAGEDVTEEIIKKAGGRKNVVFLPSYDEVSSDKFKFSEAARIFHENADSKILIQKQDTRYIIQFPRRDLTTEELDDVYDLDFERRIYPRFKNIPAFEMIRDSVTSHRGCYGDCSFCALAAHQGKHVTSRSPESVMKEIRKIASMKGFSGTISDIGGPSANMYASSCSSGECTRHDCLKGGDGCRNLVSGTETYMKLLSDAANVKGVRNIQINSGIRFDPALLDDKFLRTVMLNHVSGQMKVAPESGSDTVLKYMHKPSRAVFEEFLQRFDRIRREEGLKKYVIPYIITGHPGEGDAEARDTASFLSRNNLAGKQFQIFTPTPMTISSAMYYTGLDPFTGKPIVCEKDMHRLEKRKEILTGSTLDVKVESGRSRGMRRSNIGRSDSRRSDSKHSDYDHRDSRRSDSGRRNSDSRGRSGGSGSYGNRGCSIDEGRRSRTYGDRGAERRRRSE